MAENRGSLSEQTQRRSNYFLLVFGIVLLLLFLLAWCRMQPKEENVEYRPTEGDYRLTGMEGDGENTGFKPEFARGDAQLVITPTEVFMDKVVIGSDAEAIVTLRAENAPIKLDSKTLAEEQEEGFVLSGTCMDLDLMPANSECLLKISWNPTSLRQIQNTLTIRWREDSPTVFNVERSSIILKAQSTDSKDCVICEDIRKEAEKVPLEAVTLSGEKIDVNTDMPPIVNGEETLVTPINVIVTKKDNTPVGIQEPKRLPLNLKNELIGHVAENRDVIDFNGKKVGKLLDDDTIINPNLEVIGFAIPQVPAMNERGQVIGKTVVNGEKVQVVDARDKVLGTPRVDMQVVDELGTTIAYLSPWGMVMDMQGRIIGGILPDGRVMNARQEVVAFMRPMGLAISTTGELIGGVVPRGVVVGAGCQSYGKVSMNGQVFDSFNQNVGHVLLDKSVVDAQMNEIGSVVRQGLVIDKKGVIAGFVNSEGKAVNNKGQLIGCVSPDGSVFAKQIFVGGVMPMGRVIKESCGVVGSVYPDGTVMSTEVKPVGFVAPDGVVSDSQGSYMGFVAPWGTAIAPDCQLLGLISLNGDVVSFDGTRVGCITRDKKVQNSAGEEMGIVTPFGIWVNNQGKASGRVTLTGQILDATGLTVGCVNASKPNSGEFFDNSMRGVVVDENGYPTGWSFVAGRVYDSTGKWMGDIFFNGWVIGDKQQLVGVVPFSGMVFSDTGEVLGRYDQMSGALTTLSGATLGRVLPGQTVIDSTGTDILGRLIPFGTVFVAQDGSRIGVLESDGRLMNQNLPVKGKIYANGTVYDDKGQLMGAALQTGPVLNSSGQFIARVNDQGQVINPLGQKMGRVLSNGLAISDQNSVLGMLFPQISVPVSATGSLGSLSPKIMGDKDQFAYQGQVTDTKGNLIGSVSGSGLVLGVDNTVKGRLVPLSSVVSAQGHLLGWANFSGGVNNPEGRPTDALLPSGLVLDSAQQIRGRITESLTAVDTTGAFLGRLSSRGELLNEKGEVRASVSMSRFLYDTQGILIGQVLAPGIALDMDGNPMGWTRYDGQIENGTKVIGQVGLDGHIFAPNGLMIGRYVPFGMVGISDAGQNRGYVGDKGYLQDPVGTRLGSVNAWPYATDRGSVVARLIDWSEFVNTYNDAKSMATVSAKGETIPLAGAHILGFATLNGQTVDNSHHVNGAIVPTGIALGSTLGVLGTPYPNGQVFVGNKSIAQSTGNGLIMGGNGSLMGGLFNPGVIINKKGEYAGYTSGMAAVFFSGKQIGNKMAFQSVLNSANDWLGNILPQGVVVDDNANDLGVVLSDGAVMAQDNVFTGQVLPDGSVAGVPDRGVLNTMPYVGHTVQQGLALGYNRDVLGRTTVSGDVLDSADKKVFRILDDATIKGQDKPLAGVILPFMSAIDHDGQVMGTLAPDGQVLTHDKKSVGYIANNGTIKGENELEILGALVPEPLIVNDCKVIGQTAYDGQVINGQGAVVGRIRPDKWAIDAQGNEIGRVVRVGPVMSPEGKYLGRTLPDSTVVDLNGVEIACAQSSGEVKSFKGEILGTVVDRGPVFDDTGMMIGRVNSIGQVMNKSDEAIGLVLGDGKGTAVDFNGKRIGWVADKDQEIILNAAGNLRMTLGSDGRVRNVAGDVVFQVDRKGDYITPGGITGNIGDGKGFTFLNGIGQLVGCDLINPQGVKIATLMSDGTFRDDNNDLYATVTSDGQVYSPDGTLLDKLVGIDMNLQKCGISAATDSSAGRRVQIGDRILQVGKSGELIDEEDTIIGYMGDNGRLFNLTGKPLTDEIAKEHRERPAHIDDTIKIDPAQIADIQDRIKKRREGMKNSLTRENGTLLIPSKQLQARSKPKKDKDWTSLGIKKDKTNTSTWAVDMSHVILQGKAISAVLARPIDSRFSDSPALAIVDTNIYGEEGRNILIPAGSRLIGSFQPGGGENGVAKIDIEWKRLIRPDGSGLNLEGSSSGDMQGRGGVAAYLDKQLMNKYGVPVLTSMATSLTAYMLATNEEVSVDSNGTQTMSAKAQAAKDARDSFIGVMEEIMQQLISDAGNIPPVVYVPAGTRLVVFPKEDLWIRTPEDDEAEADEEVGPMPTMAQLPEIDSWLSKRKKDSGSNDSDDAEKKTDSGDEYEPTATPLYDGSDHMNQELSNRMVDPVLQSQTPPIF